MATKKRDPRGRKAIELAAPRDFNEMLGANIRAARLTLGLTQEAAAERTKGVVTASLWATYETGTEPRTSRFLAVCIALEMTPGELLPACAVNVMRKGLKATAAEIETALMRRSDK